ncbi:aldehyde dehydrogenase [Gloeocapsopsis dulcis]|uniref:Aldehyde dehydrogenase n=1 Tax=Gloeocapsopsis dulcis AAB1 = 1H9 TaxID=1433147 RepID=A0A6N8FZH4_9CHRO|nr:aldehyde dehydrogenase [Gloeocapsopsis dulcis]MUL38351.1 aldehyde dehydrogenase family protein [Gloeocapsopsis dulcis AAB1 = 1H9]WNN91604.1 aldehyde dehydrogenase [Gloeocapsopsis dulcis]
MLAGLTINDIICKQRIYFNSGYTKEIEFRVEQLNILKRAIQENAASIVDALKKDLCKPELETYATEISIVREVDYALKHIRSWVRPKKVKLPLEQLPSHGYVCSEPLGVVLIIGPWNYPFQLLIAPLIGAIAAGNCAILKPSEIAPNTSKVVSQIIQKYFDPAYIAVVEGGIDVSKQLLAEKFDHIFFTGGTSVGRVVMEAAAKHLTPITLELGGKSPCIVDTDINIEHTANRIVWGKFINAGQTCIAPDYLLVNSKIKPQILNSLQKTIQEFYGEEPEQSPDYARIINQKQFTRLAKLLQDGEIVTGGKTNQSNYYIAPTLLDKISLDMPVMQEEIFGPILPIIEYNDLSEAIALINEKPKPLALYLFSRDQNIQQRVLKETSSGGVCINDTVMHVAVSSLPFGGVGNSGVGKYHGKASFDTFSHHKSVLKKSFLFDPKWRYAPYAGKLGLIKRLIG